jgi:hypothetical protein
VGTSSPDIADCWGVGLIASLYEKVADEQFAD